MFHTFFNIIGASIFMVVMYTPVKDYFFEIVGAMKIGTEFKVAIFHLLFNLCAALVMIPLLRPAVWVCKKIIRH
jgi:Na+/phosphate symporter